MSGQRGFGPCTTLSFDVDFPRDIAALPSVVELLERYEVRASFACIGRWIREYPSEHKSIVDAGFEVLNHTETHPNLYHPDYDYAAGDDLARERFNQIDPSRRREEIARCHQTCVEVLGVEPAGFRTPHFGALHVSDVYAMLAELGYRFSSSTVASQTKTSGLPYRTDEGIMEFPLSPCPEHPFAVFDSWHSLSKQKAGHAKPGRLAELFGQLSECARRDGGYVNVYFDPHDTLHSGELERVVAQISQAQITVVDYAELASTLVESTPVARR